MDVVVSTGKQHSSDFSRLIAQVKGRMENTRRARVKQEVTEENKDVQESNSAGTKTHPFFRVINCSSGTRKPSCLQNVSCSKGNRLFMSKINK